MLYYNPTLDRDCPPWVYFSCAVGLFLYQTFDAVDGMQAYVLRMLLGWIRRVADDAQSSHEAKWSARRIV